jgi:hypothetical protein
MRPIFIYRLITVLHLETQDSRALEHNYVFRKSGTLAKLLSPFIERNSQYLSNSPDRLPDTGMNSTPSHSNPLHGSN